MTLTINSTDVKLSGWWGLSDEVKAAVIAALPDQDEWSFTATRISDHAWSIDVPEAQTYGELLVGETNVALDEHFYDIHDRSAENDDQLLLTVSRKPLENQTTTFQKLEEDKTWEGAATYEDKVLRIKCWLCPFTTILWGTAPDQIYIKLKSLAHADM